MESTVLRFVQKQLNHWLIKEDSQVVIGSPLRCPPWGVQWTVKPPKRELAGGRSGKTASLLSINQLTFL
jgi:hypothetical protein